MTVSYFGEYDGDPAWYPEDDEYEPMEPYTTIEYPSSGATYSSNMYGAYRYDEYPMSSVLAGQVRRSFLGEYATLEEAQAAHPDAEWSGEGSGYTAPVIPKEPPSWFDPADAGESWE